MSAFDPKADIPFCIAHVRFLGPRGHGGRAAKCLPLPKADIDSAIGTTRFYRDIGSAFTARGGGPAASEIVIVSSPGTKGLAGLPHMRLVRYAKRHHCKVFLRYSLVGVRLKRQGRWEEQMKRRQFLTA